MPANDKNNPTKNVRGHPVNNNQQQNHAVQQHNNQQPQQARQQQNQKPNQQAPRQQQQQQQQQQNYQLPPPAPYQPAQNGGGAVPKKSNLKKPVTENGKNNARSRSIEEPVFRGEATHAKQNTAMLAGHSLNTNSVQNLLVGRPGEHVSENIGQLFKEFYTDPVVMSRLSRQHQNDAIHRQLASFQRIVDEMEAQFSYSPSRFHAILVAMVNEAPHLKNNILRLGSLKDVFQERVADAQKVTGFLRDSDRKTKSFFENFLTEIHYQKRLKYYFCERIYCPLYQYYYDEFDDLNGEDTYHEKVASLAKLHRTGKKRQQKGEIAEGDLILNRKEYLMGNYKAVNSWSEKHKLSYAVEHMHNLDKRWDALLDESQMPAPEDYEPESSENMDQFNNYPAFEPILRLMPDLYVKTRKAVELATLWWTAGNKLFPANPDQMVERADVATRIGELRKQVDRLSDEVSKVDMRMIPHQRDLDDLLARDDHFNRLAADYENLAIVKKEKLERHQKLEDRISELESESPYWSRRRAQKQQQQHRPAGGADQQPPDNSEELRKVQNQMAKSFRNLRLTSYQFEITSGDYLAELTVRPTFVRFLDTCQQRLTSNESEVGERRSELTRLQRELHVLVGNHNRRREILERYTPIGDNKPGAGGNDRAAERNRVAAEQHQSRLHQTNNNKQNLDIRAISPPPSRIPVPATKPNNSNNNNNNNNSNSRPAAMNNRR